MRSLKGGEGRWSLENQEEKEPGKPVNQEELEVSLK